MTFSDAGTVASLLSLVVSVGVLYDVKRIKNTVKLKVRGPVIINELQQYMAAIERALVKFEGSVPQISKEFGRVSVKLKYLERTVHGSAKKSLRTLRQSIERCDLMLANKDEVLRICDAVDSVVEEVIDLQKDVSFGV
jgi:hypothetical protein